MREILFIGHRIPFPPDRGDKIRSHHVLKALAHIAPVHVATFSDDEQDDLYEADLARLSASYCLVRRKKPLSVAGVQALISGLPVSLTAFHDSRLERYIRHVIENRPIGTVYIFSGQMAQYVPQKFTGRVIADLVDVDSVKFEAYGAKGQGARAWMERREGRLLGIEEKRIVRESDATVLVSKAEADLLRSRQPDPGDSALPIRAMGNGMDSEKFDPAHVVPEPRVLSHGGPRLIFTGQMDYAPNVDAALRAIKQIMPRVRQTCPQATLHVVGRNPAKSLQDLSGHDGIEVWGRVDDIRPWLAAADIALIPLEIARGVQNKVLEAMSMRLPTVLSCEAATGIDALDGRDFLIAQGDAALAQAIVSLAADPARARAIGAAARYWITENASWPAALASLPDLVGTVHDGLCDAA